MSRAFDLPFFFHNRGTNGEFVDFLREHKETVKQRGGVVHSFDGDLEEAMILIDEFGLFIGVNGCSLKTEKNLAVVREIPLSRLMIETDAPWFVMTLLALISRCGISSTHASFNMLKEAATIQRNPPKKFEAGFQVKGRNEPCNVGQIVAVLAALKGLDNQEVANTVFENARKVFFEREGRRTEKRDDQERK